MHTVWNKFVQVTNAGVGQPGWVWVYDNGSGGQHGRLQRRGGEPGRPADHDHKPAQGQVMVWVMGWESSETTTTTYVTKQLNLIGDGVDPLGWLTNKNTTKKGPYVTYAQSRPVLVSTVVAYTSESSVPGVLRDQLAASGKLKDVVLPNYVEGSGKQELRADPNGPIYIPGLGRFSVVTVGGQQLESSDFVVTYRKYNTSVIVRNDGPHSSGGGWLRTKTTTLTQVVEKKQQELYTFYVPASQDINLTFLGSSSQPNAVYIRSNGDVTLGGNVIVGNADRAHRGRVVVEVDVHHDSRRGRHPGARSQWADPAGHRLGECRGLRAGRFHPVERHGFGGLYPGRGAQRYPADLFLRGGTSSRAMLQKVASSAGTVYIEALNGIYAHASAGNDTVVLGNRVELNAGYGAIGSAAKVLSIHARQGFAAQAGLAGGVAGADKSIYIAQNVANADLVLVKPVNWVNPQASVYSQLGSVSITLNGGSLLDGEKADTRTATEKAYPTVTARILADLNAQIARYEGYWSGVRALQVASITLGGAGTFLSTQLEGDGRYLAVAFERAGDYEALLKAAVDGGRLVRLAYNNSLNGNARQEILGKLIAVSNDGLNYRFQFSVYDSATGLFAAPVSMASLGYTAGSQGVLFGPAYGLAGATDTSDANLPIRFTLPATLPASTLGSGVLQMTFTQAQLNQLAASGNGADVLAALRKYTYVEIGGQKLLIDQILPVMKNGGYWGSQDFDTVLITLKTPYVGISASTNGHVSLNVVLGGGSGEYGGENYADKVQAARPGVPANGTQVKNPPAGDSDITNAVIAAINAYNTAHPSAKIPTGPGSLYDLLTNTALGKAGSVIQRSVTSNTIALAGAALGWQIPATVSSVQEYVAWLNDPANGLVGSEIKLTIDGVEVTRRIQSFDLKRADGSVSMGIYHGQLSVAGAGRYRHAEALLRARRQRHRRRPAAAVRTDLRPDGPGQGRQQGRDRLCDPARPGATALMQGSLAVDSRSAWGWWGNQNLTFYQYTETTTGGAARYGNYVSLGNGFSWDLSASNLSDAARIQMLNAIKSLLASGQNISLTGLDLFMTNDGTTRTGHQLGVYDNGKLKIVSVVDEFGNPLTAQSPDSAWLKGRIVFAGDVYAEESQLKALYAYRNLDTNDPNWSQKPIDLGGMVVNAGIRLVDSGFAQQSLAARARPR